MNVKPGDLAIVIASSVQKQDWIGRIVSVVRLSSVFKNAWIVEWQGPMPASCVGSIQAVYDKDLRPVSGLPETETTDEQIKEPA